MITFGQVSKRYPDGTVALDRLGMVAPTGQVTVMAGAFSDGKSTALWMVNRMTELTSGRVLIDGTDVRSRKSAELWRGIGYMIQQTGLFSTGPLPPIYLPPPGQPSPAGLLWHVTIRAVCQARAGRSATCHNTTRRASPGSQRPPASRGPGARHLR